jgi:hypothetical protein
MQSLVSVRTQMSAKDGIDRHLWALAERLYDEQVDANVQEVYDFLIEDIQIKTTAEFRNSLLNG